VVIVFVGELFLSAATLRHQQDGSLAQALTLVKLTIACDQPTKRPADDVEICWSKSRSVVNTDCVVLKVPDCKVIIPEAKWIVKSKIALDRSRQPSSLFG
jgi:hypothetical protein